MIIYDGKTLRNLEEQVEKNKEDILFIIEQEGTLNQFGIKVIGQADTAAELPTVADYKATHSDWAYGDTYAIGTDSPYVLDVLTRANGTHPNDYWFNIGTFPLAGPKGDKGDPGIGIDTMQVINFPSGNPSVTYDTTDGTMVHGTMDMTYMDGDSAVSENIGNVTVDIPIVYKNGLKADSTMNNDMVEVQVDFEKVVKKPATVASQNQAVVINNNGDSVGVAVQHSAPTSGSIAQRTSDGCLKVASPLADDDAVNLAYMNAHAGGSLNWYTSSQAGKDILFNIQISNQIYVPIGDGTCTIMLVFMFPTSAITRSAFRLFVTPWVLDNDYKYFATASLYSNFGSGYKVWVNIYSTETGEKVGSYTDTVSNISIYSNYFLQ